MENLASDGSDNLALTQKVSQLSLKDSVTDSNRGHEDIEGEPLADHPLFDPRLADILYKARSLAGNVATALSKCSLVTKDPKSEIARLLKESNSLRDFDCSETRTVGLVGESGQGKSSLINSLLDTQDIARTGEIGSACTAVVTEYRARRKCHQHLYTIELSYMNQEEIDNQLEELLWSYRRSYLEATIDLPKELREQLRRSSDTALGALQSAFGEEKEFSEEKLQQEHEGAFEENLSVLRMLSRRLKWPGDNGVWTAGADTQDEFTDLQSDAMQPNLWPFIRVFRVYLDSPILNVGVILADLPGFRDTNLARVEAAEKYIQKCDQVFIVARITRVITDAYVKETLKNAFNLSANQPERNFKFAVVCTGSEDFTNTKRTRKDLDREFDENEIVEWNKHEDAVKESKKARNPVPEKEAKTRMKLLLLRVRNRMVTRELQAQYHASPYGQIKVFCVSNKSYQKHKFDGAEGNLSQIAASGIPKLRSFCCLIPAQSQFESITNFLDVRVPVLLRELDLWTKSGKSKNPAKQETALVNGSVIAPTVFENLASTVADSENQSAEMTTKLIVSKILEKSFRWNREASAASIDWYTWAYQSFNAFCAHDGNHYTDAIGYRNWNHEILESYLVDMKPQWLKLTNFHKEVFSKTELRLYRQLEELGRTFKNIDDHNFFARIIDFKILALRLQMQIENRRFDEDLRVLIEDFVGTHHGSHVLQQMKSTYRTCQQDSGRGKHARQKTCMKRRLDTNTLFQTFNSAFMKRYEENLNLWVASVHKLMEDTLEAIGTAAANLSAKSESNQDPVFLRRLEGSLKQWKEDHSNTQELFERVKSRS